MDQDTNNVSLIDIAEEIAISTKRPIPSDKWSGIPVEMTLVSLFTRSDYAAPERCHLRIELVAPDGKTFNDAEIPLIEIDLDTHVRARTMVKLPAIPHRGVGVHNFVLYMELGNKAWRKVATIPVNIRHVAPTEIAAEEPPPKLANPKKKTKA